MGHLDIRRFTKIYYPREVIWEKLPYTKCKSCNKRFYYPKIFISLRGLNDSEVLESSGIGKVFSLTIIPMSENNVVYGIVELDEGFRTYSNIITKQGKVDIGEKVRVIFVDKDGVKIPLFEKIG